MTLGELKKSLARMSPDLDDSEVLLNYSDDDGNSDWDCLAFTAYSELPNGTVVIVLGSMREACNRIKKKTLRYPNGVNPSDDSFNLNG